MQSFQLERAGNRPVTFTGRKIAESLTRSATGPASKRWWKLSLYKTDSKKYVLQINYTTQWQGEYDRNDVFIKETPDAIVEQIRMAFPEDTVIGYPVGDHYAEKQQRLMQILRQAWDKAVSELMQDLPEEI